MGANNRITKDKYQAIKAYALGCRKKYNKVTAWQNAVGEKFGHARSTISTIVNSKDYMEYCERQFRFHGNPKKTAKAKVNVAKKADPFKSKAIDGNKTIRVYALQLPDAPAKAVPAPVVPPKKDEWKEWQNIAKKASIFAAIILLAFIVIEGIVIAYLAWRGHGL